MQNQLSWEAGKNMINSWTLRRQGRPRRILRRTPKKPWENKGFANSADAFLRWEAGKAMINAKRP